MPDKKLHVTCIGRLSFPALFTPKENDNGGEPKYEATLIFPPNADLSDLEAAIDTAAQIKWGDKKAVQMKRAKYPIKSNEDANDKQGERRGGYEESEGKHAKFWSTRKPKIVGREKDLSTGQLIELTRDDIWAGCWCRISYTAYAGNHPEGGNYVSLLMMNCQLMKEGESLAGIITNPDDDFADDPAVEAALA